MARLVVWVLGGFVPVEHRGKAGVAAFEQLAPLVARAGAENLGQAQLEQRPGVAVHLGVEGWVVGDAAALAQ